MLKNAVGQYRPMIGVGACRHQGAGPLEDAVVRRDQSNADALAAVLRIRVLVGLIQRAHATLRLNQWIPIAGSRRPFQFFRLGFTVCVDQPRIDRFARHIDHAIAGRRLNVRTNLFDDSVTNDQRARFENRAGPGHDTSIGQHNAIGRAITQSLDRPRRVYLRPNESAGVQQRKGKQSNRT